MPEISVCLPEIDVAGGVARADGHGPLEQLRRRPEVSAKRHQVAEVAELGVPVIRLASEDLPIEFDGPVAVRLALCSRAAIRRLRKEVTIASRAGRCGAGLEGSSPNHPVSRKVTHLPRVLAGPVPPDHHPHADRRFPDQEPKHPMDRACLDHRLAAPRTPSEFQMSRRCRTIRGEKRRNGDTAERRIGDIPVSWRGPGQSGRIRSGVQVLAAWPSPRGAASYLPGSAPAPSPASTPVRTEGPITTHRLPHPLDLHIHIGRGPVHPLDPERAVRCTVTWLQRTRQPSRACRPPRARPGPGLGPLYQPRPQRVPFDVSQDRQQTLIVLRRERLGSALPDAAAGAVVPRVAADVGCSGAGASIG